MRSTRVGRSLEGNHRAADERLTREGYVNLSSRLFAPIGSGKGLWPSEGEGSASDRNLPSNGSPERWSWAVGADSSCWTPMTGRDTPYREKDLGPPNGESVRFGPDSIMAFGVGLHWWDLLRPLDAAASHDRFPSPGPSFVS